MDIFLKIIFSMMFLVQMGVCRSQISIHQQNLKYFDSVENVVKTYYCGGEVAYPGEYNKNSLKSDLLAVDALNTLYAHGTTASQFDNILNGIKDVRIKKTENLNGLVRATEITINGKYLRITLSLDCIDDMFVRKKMILSSINRGRCSVSGERILDFKLLKNEVIGRFDFVVGARDNLEVVANVFLEDNVKIAADIHKDIKFNTSTGVPGDYCNVILRNQFDNDSSCCYSYDKADKYFVYLIRQGKFDLIKDLLYSPSYFFSINAMEAIIYLSSVNKIVIDDAMRKRMGSLKDESFRITRRASDVVTTVDGYKALSTSDKAVISKYQNSIL